MGAGRAHTMEACGHWLLKSGRRSAVPLILAGIVCAVALLLSAGDAGAQEPVPDPSDFAPQLLAIPELPVDLVRPVQAETSDGGGQRLEPDCGLVGPAATFVASTDVTTLTTDRSVPVALYTSTTPGGSFDSLTLVDCPTPAEVVGLLRTYSFDTTVGQRYWMSHSGGDSGVSTVRNADATNPDLAMRFALVSGETWRTHGGLFHTIARRDLPLDAADACRQNLVWFDTEQVTDSVTVWFDTAVGNVALYAVPDDDDPRAPTFAGPDVLMSCGPTQFEASATGSATLKVMTEPNQRYVVGWTSAADSVITINPPDDVDQRFAAPVRIDGVIPDVWQPDVVCGNGDGQLQMAPWNDGPDPAGIAASLYRTAEAVGLDDVLVQSFALTTVGGVDWTTDATLADGDYRVDVSVDGTVIATRTFTIECDTGELPPDPDSPPAPDSPTVQVVTSCAGQRVRLDVVIENHSDTAAVYIAEVRHPSFTGELPDFSKRKSAAIGADQQGRITITGREVFLPIEVDVFRDGILVDVTNHYRECRESFASQLSDAPVVTTSCLAGNGLIRYVIPNQTASAKSWIISFEGLSNRSTSAQPFGVGLGGISGRADGTYTMEVRSGGAVIWASQVTIDCD